jgi:hypothetical protein
MSIDTIIYQYIHRNIESLVQLMPTVPDTKSLLLGLVIGLLIGAAIGSTPPTTPSSSRTDTGPAASYSTAGPSCYDGPPEHAGWLHVVVNGETWAVTLNATIVHPPETEIDVNISQRPTGDYVIAFQTVETTREKSLSQEDCQTATRLTVATGLTEPKFTVTMNGRTIRSVDQDETVANLYQLPTPINATE